MREEMRSQWGRTDLIASMSAFSASSYLPWWMYDTARPAHEAKDRKRQKESRDTSAIDGPSPARSWREGLDSKATETGVCVWIVEKWRGGEGIRTVEEGDGDPKATQKVEKGRGGTTQSY